MSDEREPLKVAGVIGDPTRYAIYEYICTSGVERVTAQDIAARFGLHPNVARLHLNKLKDVGLLTAHPEKSGRGGRPGMAYSLADKVLTLHFPPRDYRLLAELLTQALARMGDQGKQALAQVSRDFVRRIEEEDRAKRPRPGGSKDAAGGGDPGTGRTSIPREALEDVAAALARHGVHAEVTSDEHGAVNLILRNCSFKEVATHYPELVCRLCENIVRGVVDAHLQTPEVHEEASIPRGDRFCVYVAEK